MKGISEEEFISLCEELHKAILDGYNKREKEDKSKEGIDLTEILITSAASNIIDESNGFIDTEDEKMQELFHEVFSLAKSIKQNTQFASHHKANLKRNLSDSELEQSALAFITTRKILLASYKNALIATDKVLNMGRKK